MVLVQDLSVYVHVQIDLLLEQIPTMLAETQIIESCSGAAIDAAILALQVCVATVQYFHGHLHGNSRLPDLWACHDT